MTAPTTKPAARYRYTSSEIAAVEKAVRAGEHLKAVCKRLQFHYPSVWSQLWSMGIATELQHAKREAQRERKRLESPRTKARNHCCTCGTKFSKPQTWAYCSKRCELGRKATAERADPTRSCRSCDAFCASPRRNSEVRTGTCRANPPGAKGWPAVAARDWCLAWRAKQAGELPAGRGSAGLDRGQQPFAGDPQPVGDQGDRAAVHARPLALAPAADGQGPDPGFLAPFREATVVQHVAEQVVDGFGSAGTHGPVEATANRQKRPQTELYTGAEKVDIDDMAEGDPATDERNESAPTAANLGGATAAGASPEPQRNETMSNATGLYSLCATNVSADDSCAYVDGVIVDLLVTHVAGDPSVGYPASIDVEHLGAPRLDSRDDWDAAHPDVEPTAENMLALVESAADAIQEHVEEAVARRADDWAPDDDGPEWNDSDERGWS